MKNCHFLAFLCLTLFSWSRTVFVKLLPQTPFHHSVSVQSTYLVSFRLLFLGTFQTGKTCNSLKYHSYNYQSTITKKKVKCSSHMIGGQSNFKYKQGDWLAHIKQVSFCLVHYATHFGCQAFISFKLKWKYVSVGCRILMAVVILNESCHCLGFVCLCCFGLFLN